MSRICAVDAVFRCTLCKFSMLVPPNWGLGWPAQPFGGVIIWWLWLPCIILVVLSESVVSNDEVGFVGSGREICWGECLLWAVYFLMLRRFSGGRLLWEWLNGVSVRGGAYRVYVASDCLGD